jgi:hypothetical protein
MSSMRGKVENETRHDKVRQAVASCSGSCPPTTCTFLGTPELTPDQLSNYNEH